EALGVAVTVPETVEPSLGAVTAAVGGVVSRTLIWTVSVAVGPCESLTVNFTVVVPRGNLTVGWTPLAVPLGHAQVNVRESPSGSAEPDPSRVTIAPSGSLASTTWSGPASARGARFGCWWRTQTPPPVPAYRMVGVMGSMART